ncbi:hypothetical protein Pint_21674 [Pistacia integerrima]|uniref:Uncharacterized protein n=1 Tax=Pistacia integerrima TaxID=434235 RepID=A0ACC0XA46_9ROSI|nr:hypothetical protein Pint_21674 [Pistacia integerrima]
MYLQREMALKGYGRIKLNLGNAQESPYLVVVLVNCGTQIGIVQILNSSIRPVYRGSSFKIPEDFFTVMPKLKVLNLFNMHQFLLPSSLDLLTNLQTLCFDGSHITSVAIIGKLEKLKVLSLQHSYIQDLPIEIG